jgi:hypothetical protein
MEIHKPHAAKTWPEFFIEIGTIVTGILIALALEQGLEALHEQRMRNEAQEAVRDEAGQNLFWVKYREANEPCIKQHLTEIGDLLDRAERHERFAVAHHLSQSIYGKIATQVWDANGHAGRTSLFSREDQRNFGNLYFTTSDFQTFQSREVDAWSRLSALRDRSTLSQSAIDALREALAQARYYDVEISWTVYRTKQWAQILNLEQKEVALPGFTHRKSAAACFPITETRAPPSPAKGSGAQGPPEDL